MIDWLASAITGHLYLLLLTRLVGIMTGYYFPCLYISSWRSKRRRGCMAKFGNSKSFQRDGLLN